MHDRAAAGHPQIASHIDDATGDHQLACTGHVAARCQCADAIIQAQAAPGGDVIQTSVDTSRLQNHSTWPVHIHRAGVIERRHRQADRTIARGGPVQRASVGEGTRSRDAANGI